MNIPMNTGGEWPDRQRAARGICSALRQDISVELEQEKFINKKNRQIPFPGSA